MRIKIIKELKSGSHFNLWVIALLFSFKLHAQTWKVVLYDDELNPKGLFLIKTDSVSYTNQDYLKFNAKDYYSSFKGGFIRLVNDSLDIEPISHYDLAKDNKEKNKLVADFFKNEPYLFNPRDSGSMWSLFLNVNSVNLPDGRWIKIDDKKNKIYEFEIKNKRFDGFIYIYYQGLSNRPEYISHFSHGVWSGIRIRQLKTGEILFLNYLFNHSDVDESYLLNINRKSDGTDWLVDYPDHFSIEYDEHKNDAVYYSMKHGKKNGPAHYTMPNEEGHGYFTVYGNYLNGFKEGVFKTYDSKNKLVMEEFFEKGKQIWQKKYN